MQISLRGLMEKDALYMLEWMHDADIQKCFQKNMLGMQLQDVIAFCNKNQSVNECIHNTSLHFAIVDEEDEYLGTISLKDIDLNNRTAEYAISTRKKAHGRGIAKKATGLLLKMAYEDFHLHKVYLNVLDDNAAAIRLYERCGFVYEGCSRECVRIADTFRSLKWYGLLECEYQPELFKDN